MKTKEFKIEPAVSKVIQRNKDILGIDVVNVANYLIDCYKNKSVETNFSYSRTNPMLAFSVLNKGQRSFWAQVTSLLFQKNRLPLDSEFEISIHESIFAKFIDRKEFHKRTERVMSFGNRNYRGSFEAFRTDLMGLDFICLN